METVYDILYVLRTTAEISLYLVGIKALKSYIGRYSYGIK